MWFIFAPESRSDAPYWLGRRSLAALDAAMWPLLFALVFWHVPEPIGLVGPVVSAVAVLCALVRLHRALWLNHRYWFTTWRWGRAVAVLLVVGASLHLTFPG